MIPAEIHVRDAFLAALMLTGTIEAAGTGCEIRGDFGFSASARRFLTSGCVLGGGATLVVGLTPGQRPLWPLLLLSCVGDGVVCPMSWKCAPSSTNM